MVVLKVSLDIDMFNLLNRNKVIFALTAFLFICTLSTALAPQALAQPTSTDNSQSPPTNETIPKNEDGTTCAVEKVGWIVCPIVEASAFMGDKLFAFLASNFLETERELVSSDAKNGTVVAWELARNIANILFIIAFIVVIYSQITSAGISNYGIKRMLPRLIIVAIAVNVSYIICQLMVDASNFLGYAIKDWLVALSHTVFSQSAMPVSDNGFANSTQTSTLGTIATIGLASAVVWMLLGPLVGMVGLIMATCIAIIVILLLRKTFIILLVVVSPLAFVAYLLPNTEKLFSKWLHMFWQLLLVFPIVAMLMGGGQLASAIILASGQDNYRIEGEECIYLPEQNAKAPDQKCEGDDGPGIMLALVAAGVAVAPLLAVFAVMKGALAAAGAIGGRIAQGVQRGSGGVSKGAEGKFANSAMGRGIAIRKAAKANYKTSQFAARLNEEGEDSKGVKGVVRRARGRYTRTAAGGVSGMANQLGVEGTGSMKAQSNALARVAVSGAAKAEHEDIQNEETRLRRDPGGLEKVQESLQKALLAGDEIKAKAAQNVLLTSGGKGVDEFAKAMANVESRAKSELIAALKQNTLQNHGSVKEKSGAVAHWAASGGGTLTSSQGSADAYSGLSDKQLATQTGGSAATAGAMAALAAPSRTADGGTESRAHRILNNTSASEDISGSTREIMEQLSNRSSPPPPPSGGNGPAPGP